MKSTLLLICLFSIFSIVGQEITTSNPIEIPKNGLPAVVSTPSYKIEWLNDYPSLLTYHIYDIKNSRFQEVKKIRVNEDVNVTKVLGIVSDDEYLYELYYSYTLKNATYLINKRPINDLNKSKVVWQKVYTKKIRVPEILFFKHSEGFTLVSASPEANPELSFVEQFDLSMKSIQFSPCKGLNKDLVKLTSLTNEGGNQLILIKSVPIDGEQRIKGGGYASEASFEFVVIKKNEEPITIRPKLKGTFLFKDESFFYDFEKDVLSGFFLINELISATPLELKNQGYLVAQWNTSGELISENKRILKVSDLISANDRELLKNAGKPLKLNDQDPFPILNDYCRIHLRKVKNHIVVMLNNMAVTNTNEKTWINDFPNSSLLFVVNVEDGGIIWNHLIPATSQYHNQNSFIYVDENNVSYYYEDFKSNTSNSISIIGSGSVKGNKDVFVMKFNIENGDLISKNTLSSNIPDSYQNIQFVGYNSFYPINTYKNEDYLMISHFDDDENCIFEVVNF